MQPSPASKASPGLLQSILPTPALGLAHPSTYPPPPPPQTHSHSFCEGPNRIRARDEERGGGKEGQRGKSLGAGERKEKSGKKGIKVDKRRAAGRGRRRRGGGLGGLGLLHFGQSPLAGRLKRRGPQLYLGLTTCPRRGRRGRGHWPEGTESSRESPPFPEPPARRDRGASPGMSQ